MVSSNCSIAAAFYTLPLVGCWCCSILSILSIKLPIFKQLQQSSLSNSANSTKADDQALKQGRWPVWSIDFAKPSISLLVWCCFPMFGYAVIRGFSDCGQYEYFCWQVEDQTTTSHARNSLHLLAVSIILAFLCKVPPSSIPYRVLFAGVACCEFLINKYTWKNCEEFMAHSLSADSSFGFFDVFIATTTMLSIFMLLCEGLPSLRKCFQKLFQMMGFAADQNPELHLNFVGQRNYLIYWILIVVFHVSIFVVFADVHVHHWVGFIVASLCIFETPISRLLLLKSVAWRKRKFSHWHLLQVQSLYFWLCLCSLSFFARALMCSSSGQAKRSQARQINSTFGFFVFCCSGGASSCS